MANCLVVVDVQRGFVGPCTEHVPERVCRLIDAGSYDHVVATQFKNREGSPYIELMNWTGLMSEEEQELYPGVAARVEQVFPKYVYTCFNDEFERFLAQNDVTDLHFVGIDTDCCVLKCASDAFERGYRLKVLTDCCASNGGERSHEAGILVMSRTIGIDQLGDSGCCR